MSDGGKGDAPRPLSVPLKQFNDNWDAIFKKKPEPEVKDESRTKTDNRSN
jgi:hypothetical protein